MKKTHRRLWCGLLAALCLTAGLGAAAAADGGRTLATLSYLKDTFLPALEKGMGERARQGTQAAYDGALARADGLGKKYSGTQGGAPDQGWTVTGTFQPTALKGGSTLTLDEGGSVLWLAGSGTGTGLVDATAGAEVPAGGALVPGHRYLNGQEGSAAVVSVASDAARAAPAGRWTLSGGGDVTAFFDLCRSDWFYQGVRWAIGKGVFVGVSATEFDPGGAVTRGTLATVLHRLEGGEAGAYAGTFSDVPEGQWYTAGVEWAAAKGVVSGGGDGTFSPGQTATREQIAVMLCQYARYLELDVSGAGALEGFADNAAVSAWARDAVAWAVDAGIISGAGGSLLPQDNATRAQVALMLQNFQKWSGRA